RADLWLAIPRGPRAKAVWTLGGGDAGMAADPAGEPVLRQRAGLGGGELAVLENHQRRNRAYIVARRRAVILVDVELDDLDLAVEFLRDLLEDRSDLPAGAAPLRPEVH